MNIELLETSFAQVEPQALEFSASFYETLFRHNPDVAPLFANTSQQAQEAKLIISLAVIVENLRNPEALGPALKSLGARHFQVGTLEAHYPLVGEALLETFAIYLGQEWTPVLAATWLEAYNAIAHKMIEGAKDPDIEVELELTFYDWIVLYGECSPKLKDMIKELTRFQYGSSS